MSPRELAAWMALERIPVAPDAAITRNLERCGRALRTAEVLSEAALLTGDPVEITAAGCFMRDVLAITDEWDAAEGEA